MAPRSKSSRQSKTRSASQADSSVTTFTEPNTAPVVEDLVADTVVNRPPSPNSTSRTYAEAVRSAPPSPHQTSASTRSAPAAFLPPPIAAVTADAPEVEQDSLEGTSITISATRVLSTPYVVGTAIEAREVALGQHLQKSPRRDAATSAEQHITAPPAVSFVETSSQITYTTPNAPQHAAAMPPNPPPSAYPPSPISNRAPLAAMSQTRVADAAGTPGSDWTLVAGRPPTRLASTAAANNTARMQVSTAASRVLLDKGKGRGPPGPPSPSRSGTRQQPGAMTGASRTVDWTAMPRDFYHQGTVPLEYGDPGAAPGAVGPSVPVPGQPLPSDDGRREDFRQREAKRARRHSPIQEDDPFVPLSKDLERMNAYETNFPEWSATPVNDQTLATPAYANVSDPITRAYEEGLLAGRARASAPPHLVPIPLSPDEAAADTDTNAAGSRFHRVPAESYGNTRGPFQSGHAAATPSLRPGQWTSQPQEPHMAALQDITNAPGHSSTHGSRTSSSKPYYSARPSDIQARFPSTAVRPQHERAQQPEYGGWRPSLPADANAAQRAFARRPPTPYPARSGSSRLSQDYDELPWLLSPTRRGILSEPSSSRVPASEYAGASNGPPHAGRTYISRLATLEPYAPQRIVFTPTPPQGWDVIHRQDPEELLAGVDPEKLPGLLEEDPDCTVMIQAYKLRYPTPSQIRETTESLTTLAREATGETGFKIIPPEPSWNEDGTPRGEAAVWAIVRLSREGARRLIEGRVWSSQLLSVFAFARIPAPGRFLFTLGGFTHDDDGDIIRTVWETFNGPQILPSIIRLARGNPAFSNLSPEEAAGVILASLEVQVSTLDNGNLVAAVFCDSPTATIPLWRQWRDGMLGIRFRSLFNSTATARRPSRCGGCHSASHLTHLCPFPAVPGWNATPPTDREQLQPPRPSNGRTTLQGDPSAPSRFNRITRGRGGNASRAAPRRRQNERRPPRDDYERSGYDGKDFFGSGGHDGRPGFDREDYM